ncbi:MAG: hypothetical protein GXP36_12040 [Actinobacteria bacterium]|nr:hypothetical protein [Actinomycetota bacterium]
MGVDGLEVAPTTVEMFAAGNVYALIEALPPRFHRNATWLAGSSTYNTIHRF